MEGKPDNTFGTFQRDMFESGLVSEIGANCFVIWIAIKTHADFNTGTAWPSIRRIAAITGLADKTVQKALKELQEAHLLKIVKSGNQRQSSRYIARERLDIKLGNRLLCRIVMDYVPAKIKATMHSIQETLKTGERNPNAFSQVEIIPGDGFKWNTETGTLQGEIPIREIPAREQSTFDSEAFAASALGLKMAGIKSKSKLIKK
jgi:DNA-binding transcriptional regulator YhcF (GntR family)